MLIGRRGAAQPFRIELSDVSLSERAIFEKPFPLRLFELRRKQQQWPKHGAQEEENEDEDLVFEIGQRGSDVENAIADQSRQQCTIGNQQRDKGIDRGGEKSQA